MQHDLGSQILVPWLLTLTQLSSQLGGGRMRVAVKIKRLVMEKAGSSPWLNTHMHRHAARHCSDRGFHCLEPNNRINIACGLNIIM